jgi:hypothetical protein
MVRQGWVPGEGHVRADGLAHRSYGDRVAMAETGATSTLVGTVLAQNRSSMIRVDKGKQATAHTFSPITSIIANY